MYAPYTIPGAEKETHMSIQQVLSEGGVDEAHVCADPMTGLFAIIAIHSTALGPAIGGTRWRAYNNEAEALTDVVRLAKGMTYKAALAGLPHGGGKAVIAAPHHPVTTADRAAMFRRFGKF